MTGKQVTHSNGPKRGRIH